MDRVSSEIFVVLLELHALRSVLLALQGEGGGRVGLRCQASGNTLLQISVPLIIMSWFRTPERTMPQQAPGVWLLMLISLPFVCSI